MKLPLISALLGASAMASVAVAAPAEDSSKDAPKQPMVLSSTQMDVVTAGGEDGTSVIRLVGLNPAGRVVPTKHALKGKGIEPLVVFH